MTKRSPADKKSNTVKMMLSDEQNARWIEVYKAHGGEHAEAVYARMLFMAAVEGAKPLRPAKAAPVEQYIVFLGALLSPEFDQDQIAAMLKEHLAGESEAGDPWA